MFLKLRSAVACVGVSVGLLACAESTSFRRFSLSDALLEIGDQGGTIEDQNGDGVPDTIVGDDGTLIPIEPPGTPPPADLPQDSDPTAPPPIRDSSGNCIFTTSTAAKNFSSSDGEKTYTSADLGGQKNFLLNLRGNGNTITIDLGGASVERIIILHAGNSNRVNVTGAKMSVGVCNQMSGGSNTEFLDASNEAALVDLQSGTGNNNNLDVRFLPSYGLRYKLSGSDNCLSAPQDTEVLSESGDGAKFDGTTCLSS